MKFAFDGDANANADADADLAAKSCGVTKDGG